MISVRSGGQVFLLFTLFLKECDSVSLKGKDPLLIYKASLFQSQHVNQSGTMKTAGRRNLLRAHQTLIRVAGTGHGLVRLTKQTAEMREDGLGKTKRSSGEQETT